MGKKIKTEINWSLDKGNNKGDIIILTQYAQTESGIINFLGQAPTYSYYAEKVNKHLQESRLLHEKVLALPVSDNGAQDLLDDRFLSKIYQHGSGLVTNLYLMYEHMATHAGITLFRQRDRNKFNKFEKLDLNEKIKEILKFLDAIKLIKSEGYGVMCVVRVRETY